MSSSNRPAVVALAIVAWLAGALPCLAQNTQYAQMATPSQYLEPGRKSEIALARSAAPPSISQNASVLVLTLHGYVEAAKGTNGFTCLVERAWMKHFEDPQFWNWHARAPVCYNAAASGSILPYTIFRSNLVLKGITKDRLLDRLKAAIAAKQLPALEPGAMAYMMSKRQYLNDMSSPSWHPHVMFYAPASAAANGGASYGANLSGSPVVFDTYGGTPEPWTIFFVPVWQWSDGSPATMPM